DICSAFDQSAHRGAQQIEEFAGDGRAKANRVRISSRNALERIFLPRKLVFERAKRGALADFGANKGCVPRALDVTPQGSGVRVDQERRLNQIRLAAQMEGHATKAVPAHFWLRAVGV